MSVSLTLNHSSRVCVVDRHVARRYMTKQTGSAATGFVHGCPTDAPHSQSQSTIRILPITENDLVCWLATSHERPRAKSATQRGSMDTTTPTITTPSLISNSSSIITNWDRLFLFSQIQLTTIIDSQHTNTHKGKHKGKHQERHNDLYQQSCESPPGFCRGQRYDAAERPGRQQASRTQHG